MWLTYTGVKEDTLGEPPSILQSIKGLIAIGSFGFPLGNFKWYEDLLDVCAKQDWNLHSLHIREAQNCCKYGYCPTDPVTFICFRGIVRFFTAQADLTSITWSFLLSTEAIWKSTLRSSSSVLALFTVVSDSFIGVPLMFSSFTSDRSIMVMSVPQSNRT